MRLNNIDLVQRVVIQPMMDRGLQPRKGAKLEVIAGDYADALGSLPESALSQAMRDIFRDWQFPSWAGVADIRKAASRYTTLPDEDGQRSSATDPELSRRNKKAYDYARGRLLVDDGSLLLRLMRHGPWLRQQIEKFLVEKAQEQLKAGALEAHVRNDVLEAEIASLVSEQDARTASQTAVAEKGRAPRKIAQAPIEGES